MDKDSDPARVARQYAQVASAIDHLRANALHQPALADVAAAAGLSEHQLQRLFSEWAGVSPRRFLQALTKERALQALQASADLLQAAPAAALPVPGRLHGLRVSCETITPGETRAPDGGLSIGHGFASTPFGEALLGWTPRGLCHFEFCDGLHAAQLAALRARWPHAILQADARQAAALSRRVFPAAPLPGRLHLVLRGTTFQIKVWEALLRTQPGQLLSYAQLATLAGVPDAVRAVGSAVGANTLGYLIPCHRVIRGSGESGDYRWGPARKLALQAWECARSRAPQAVVGGQLDRTPR